jgi:hypothetical protein
MSARQGEGLARGHGATTANSWERLMPTIIYDVQARMRQCYVPSMREQPRMAISTSPGRCSMPAATFARSWERHSSFDSKEERTRRRYREGSERRTAVDKVGENLCLGIHSSSLMEHARATDRHINVRLLANLEASELTYGSEADQAFIQITHSYGCFSPD